MIVVCVSGECVAHERVVVSLVVRWEGVEGVVCGFEFFPTIKPYRGELGI